jgi:hypothetical protein
MMDCARVRSRALEILRAAMPRAPPRPTLGALRPLSPPVVAITGARPTFEWTGWADATLELCDDRACTHVRSAIRARSPFRPPAALASGRTFWRVRAGAATSSTRVAWISPNETSTLVVPDIDCDGMPDVPLEMSGWYAHFDAAGTPHLVALPGDEFATASTSFGGDLDGDGCGDFVQVAGYGVFALFGALHGPSAPSMFSPAAADAIASGDLDRDGIDDLLATRVGSVSMDLSSSRGHDVAPGVFAYDARPVGDVDRDGQFEFALRSFNSMDQHGEWSILHASSRAAPTITFTLPITRPDQFLYALGDVDGDSFDDVAFWNAESPSSVRLRVLHGSARGLVATPRENVPTSDASIEVFGVGDVDGDRRGDTIWLEGHHVALRHGSPRGLDPSATTLTTWPDHTDLIVQRVPGTSVVWLFAPFELRAWRVEAGVAHEVALTAP